VGDRRELELVGKLGAVRQSQRIIITAVKPKEKQGKKRSVT